MDNRSQAGTPVSGYPGKAWDRHARPELLGWSADSLREIRLTAAAIGLNSYLIVQGGKIVDEWGPISERIPAQSVRKSFMSALIGIAVASNKLNLQTTIAELNLDDYPDPLTLDEKQATVLDLLRARSGVYHPAAGAGWPLPSRGSHAAGTFWAYNNWDFNVLGAIYERAMAEGVYDALKQRIADPLQMEDFRATDGEYWSDSSSIYPAYLFNMSARDMARFGLLYLRKGSWKGRQVVPSSWVETSVRAHSEVAPPYFKGGYGYMWWVESDIEGFSARGGGGHVIEVLPRKDLVIVTRVLESDEPKWNELDPLLRRIALIAPGPP